MHDAGPSGQGQGTCKIWGVGGIMEMLLRDSRVVFAKVRTLPFPCGQPRDAAKEHARKAWSVGDQLSKVS